MTASVGSRSDSVEAVRIQELSGLIAFSTSSPPIGTPATCSRVFRAEPKNPTASSIAIGVDHQAPREGTLPETVIAFEPARRITPTRGRRRRPDVLAEQTACTIPFAGSIDAIARCPGRAPGWI